MNKQILSKLVSGFFYFAFAVFILIYMRRLDFETIKDVEISYGFIFLSMIFSLANRFFNSYVWMKILENLGAKVNNYSELNYVYAKAWLGRYVPGKVTWILGKIYFASKHGISKKKLGVSSVFEGGLQVLTGFLFGSILLFITNGLYLIHPKLQLFLMVFTFLICFLLIPAVFNKIMKLMYWVLKKKSIEQEHMIDWKLILRSLLFFSVSMTIGGISYFLLTQAIFPLSLVKLPYYIGAINIASSIGIASIIAPSGIGVKEGILILFFNEIMPKDIVVVVTIFSRIWGLIMDLMFFIISYFLSEFRKESNCS